MPHQCSPWESVHLLPVDLETGMRFVQRVLDLLDNTPLMQKISTSTRYARLIMHFTPSVMLGACGPDVALSGLQAFENSP